ncbi:MAG: diguanylate cyclase [Oleispira sp.]|nr:diguanylate cyclase [Oleispira sp.]MBL4881376.1 diguanylate cyclase [Oleispira sp.]
MPEHYSNQLKAIFSEFVIDAMNGIMVFDGNDQIIFSNNSAAEIYGLTDGNLLYGKTFNQMVSHCHHTNTGLIINTDDLDTWLEYAKNKRRSQNYRRFEIDLQDGRWFQVSEQLVQDNCIVMITTDITDKKDTETRLSNMSKELFLLATTDSLTNAFNRRHFMEKARTEQKRCQREKSGYALLMLDLDSFKAINDNYGHACGDAVLIGIAEMIKVELRDYDLLGRIGGEEFAILLPNTIRTSAFSISERIRCSIENLKIESNGYSVSATVSIGVALDENSNKDLEEMFLIADKLLYHAKENGRNQVVLCK